MQLDRVGFPSRRERDRCQYCRPGMDRVGIQYAFQQCADYVVTEQAAEDTVDRQDRQDRQLDRQNRTDQTRPRDQETTEETRPHAMGWILGYYFWSRLPFPTPSSNLHLHLDAAATSTTVSSFSCCRSYFPLSHPLPHTTSHPPTTL